MKYYLMILNSYDGWEFNDEKVLGLYSTEKLATEYMHKECGKSREFEYDINKNQYKSERFGFYEVVSIRPIALDEKPSIKLL